MYVMTRRRRSNGEQTARCCARLRARRLPFLLRVVSHIIRNDDREVERTFGMQDSDELEHETLCSPYAVEIKTLTAPYSSCLQYTTAQWPVKPVLVTARNPASEDMRLAASFPSPNRVIRDSHLCRMNVSLLLQGSVRRTRSLALAASVRCT